MTHVTAKGRKLAGAATLDPSSAPALLATMIEPLA